VSVTRASPCDGEPTDITEGATRDDSAYVQGVRSSSGRSFSYYTCANTADCAELAAAAASHDSFSYNVSWDFSEVDDTEMSGGTQWTGTWEEDGTCSEPERDDVTATLDASTGQVVLTMAITIGESHPQDEDGYCTTADAAAACDAAECTSVETWTVTPVE
jgi:hypothetical protein